MDIETELIHTDHLPQNPAGAVVTPIYQSANYLFESQGQYENIRYGRLNNTPNQILLGQKIAGLEKTEDALVLASGMAAISNSLLSLLASGDHLLVQKTLYGGTMSLILKEFSRLGIEFDILDSNDPSAWDRQLRGNTKAIYVEAISNPLMEVPCFEDVVRFARDNRLVSLIDSTFATPINFRPADVGFDLILHSATKYLNGHSDVVAGVVAGRRDLIQEVRRIAAHLGGSLDPHACFLLERGLKTLAVRVERQNATALELAHFLSQAPQVKSVNYPGLETSSSYGNAKRYFSGFGGMLSFELQSPQVEDFLKSLKIPLYAASLGGVESLVIQPARSSHLSLTPAERERAGISEGLIRFSVGLESAKDLIEDLRSALSHCG
ncbi:MAG: PLP-dependent aspartate aminotransferase family protein [Bdellovibrionales bacterium]